MRHANNWNSETPRYILRYAILLIDKKMRAIFKFSKVNDLSSF